MKKKKFIYAALAMAMGLASCSSDDAAVDNTDGGNVAVTPTVDYKPVQSSVMKFLSNGEPVSNDGPVGVTNATSSTIDTGAAWDVVNNYLTEGAANYSKVDTSFMFVAEKDMEVELYPVYWGTGQASHEFGVFYYDTEGNLIKLPAGTLTKDNVQNAIGQKNNIPGFKISVKAGYRFGLYWNGDASYYTNVHQQGGQGGPGGYGPGRPGQSGQGNQNVIYTGSYTTSSLTYFSLNTLNPAYKTINNDCTKWYNSKFTSAHAGTFTDGDNTYIGIEDWTDFDYQDIVFMFNTKVKTTDETDVKPTPDPDPEPEPTPEPDPTPTPTPQPDPTPTPDPAEPEVTAKGGSVEVNLALNAERENGDYLESHLSVHVRDTTDFTLFIPVEAQYYCDADDMMIVAKHGDEYIRNEVKETTSMTIDGNVVTLNVTFSEKGITIASEGINSDVLKYLRKKYEDGLTFEVRNYYNETLTREALKELLDQSTIAFSNAPKTYVLAKGLNGDTVLTEDALACYVTPTDADKRTAPTAPLKSDHEKSNLYIYPLK